MKIVSTSNRCHAFDADGPLIIDEILTNFWCEMLMANSGTKLERGGRGKVSPVLFQKLEKSALICGKKCPDCGHLWVTFSFKMQFLRVSRRKKPNIFSLRGLSFLCCRWTFIEMPEFQENFLALKNSWLRAWSWWWINEDVH